MRVLHVTPYYGEAWAYGGIPRVVAALAPALVRRGHTVTVCATDAGDEVARAGVRPRGVDPEGVELHLFPNLSNRLAYRFQFFTPVGLGAFVAREAARFDVAHLHGCHNLPGAAASRALVRARVPYLVAPNGTAPRIERRRLAKWLFDRTLGRGLLPRASRVLAVSEAERRTLARLGVPAVKLVVVPNPLDLAEIDAGVADPAGFRRRFGIPAAATVVSYLGQLTPRKLVPVLVRAVARLERDDTWLVIAGNDAGAGRAVRAEVLRLGLESRTTFTGLLRGGDRLDALAAAAVVVYPGHDEVFGLVVLEALVLGLPVVVAADSGAAELVALLGGGEAVPPGDDAALAGAIGRLLAAGSDAPAAASRAAVVVRERFSADAVAARLEEVYSEMAGGPRP